MALEDWTVEEWLEKAGLGEWATAFNDNGYDTPDLCASLSAEALDEIGVKDKMHREALFSQAKMLRETLDQRLSASGEAAYPTYSEPWNPLPDADGSKPLSVPMGFRPYSEPWNERDVLVGLKIERDGMATHKVVNGGLPSKPAVLVPSGLEKVDGSSGTKMKRKISGEKVKGPPKPSRQRGPKLPVSPTLPPAPYQKKGTLTKLQLKLKIRDELQKDRLILSEPPYSREDGSVDEALLVGLAEEYGKRFQVDDLEVYDALREYWKNLANKSSFATPATGLDEADSHHKPHMTSKSSVPDTNYDEPFDAKSGYNRPPPPAVHKMSSLEGESQDEEKSRTLPANGFQGGLIYDEPFDSVQSGPKLVLDTPPDGGPVTKHKGKPKPETVGTPKIRTQIKSHSHDSDQQEEETVSPKSPSPKSGQKGFWKFGRKREAKKSRSQSVREFDVVDKKRSKRVRALPAVTQDDSSFHAKKKHSSAENLAEADSKDTSRPNRKSMPSFTVDAPPPLPPNHPTRDGGHSTSTESDDSPRTPKKMLNGRKSHSPPMNRLGLSPEHGHRERLRSDSDTEMEKSMSMRRMGRTCASADFDEHSPERKLALLKSQSYDELRAAVEQRPSTPTDKQRKKSQKHHSSIFSKFIKRVSSKSNTRNQQSVRIRKPHSSVSSEGLVSSLSMPDIVSGAVNLHSNMADSEGHLVAPDAVYTEVFDAVKQSKSSTSKPLKPPRKPKFARSPLVSPDISPPVHRKMIIKSSPSVGSSTDHLIIPIHSGSAPLTGYMDQAKGDSRHLGRSPEPGDDFKFSDSDDTRSERTGSIESRTTNGSTHSRSHSHHSLNQEAALTPGESRPPLADDTLSQGSRRSSTESATTSERGGTLTRKPVPPPKPVKSLTIGSRPSPPTAPRKPPALAGKPVREPQKVGTQGGGGGEDGPTPTRPPPKPARSKYRSTKIGTAATDGGVGETDKKKNLERTVSPKAGLTSPRLLEKSGSEGNLLEGHVSNESVKGSDSLPSTPSFSNRPQPKPRPRPARPPRARPNMDSLVLGELLLSRLQEEGIELTEEPYTNVHGEGYIPYPLITRYADEQHHSTDKIAKAMEEVRGKELAKLSREYKPQDLSSLQDRAHPSVETVDDLLISAGLPMYRTALKKSGYRTLGEVLKLTNTDLVKLQVRPMHRQILLRAVQYHIVL